MAGVRDRNLRSGNLHEEFGLLLLRPIALVAHVPIWEDVGLDAVATIIKPEGGRRLIPEDTFAIQLKASSKRFVSYTTPDAVRWLMNLRLPLLIGSVRMKEAAIDLYSTHNLFKIRFHANLREVHLRLDTTLSRIGKTKINVEKYLEHTGSPEIGRVSLSAPILTWTVRDLADSEFPARVYPVLKAHITALQADVYGRPLGTFKPMTWQTGHIPEYTGAVSIHTGGDGTEFRGALESLITPVRLLLTDTPVDELPAVFGFVQVIRKLGVDLDPGDAGVKMALARGGPPDLLRRILGKLLAHGMTPVRVWSQGQLIEPVLEEH